MDSWLSDDLKGFSIAAGRGNKATIDLNDPTLTDAIKAAIELNPQNLTVVCQQLNTSIGVKLTKDQLIRF